MRVGTTPHRGDAGLDEGAATLRVRLLGELAMELGGAPLGPVESTRARSLLGYLALHRDAPHSRQRLAFMLWPDSTEAQARTNLRKALHTLRRDVPDLERFLMVTPQTLRWSPDEASWVDVEALHAALARAADHDANADEVVDALDGAVRLYGGDLLDGCDDEWIMEVRERVRDTFVAALTRLAAAHSHRGDHVEAVRVAREVVRREPLQEAGYRLLMTAHAAAGDRAAAVRTYHQCVATLQRELGVDPADETTEAYAALTRSSGDTVADAPAAAERSVEPGATSLVGRADEWHELTRLWRDAESGRPRLAVVSGEPGVGKTRLVEELADWCAHRGATVARARSYAAEGELGFDVVIAWLRTTAMQERLERAARADLAELARLLPELDDGAEPPAGLGDDSEQRRRLFDAVARVVVVPERPTLLVLDDAQWSDPQSLHALHYVLRSSAGRRVLAVATVRLEEVGDAHPLADLVGALTVAGGVADVPLRRFEVAETGRLAGELLGRDMEAADVDALHADTEGNPLFVVEAIRAGWSGGDGGATVTPRLQAVIGARVRQLTDASRELLTVAATVGRAFGVALLREVSDLDDAAFAQALDELWRRGLVRDHGADDYDFSHGRIRDAVYDAIDPATRRHHHHVVANALERLHASALDAVSGQIAAQHDAAGAVEDAIDWYARAAAEAQRRYATVEALRLLDRAHELVRTLDEAHRVERELAVLSALPTPLASVEGFASERLVDLQRRVVDVATRLGRDVEPHVLRSIVMSRLCNDEFGEAVAAAGQLHDAAVRAGDVGMGIESEYLMGIGCFWGSELDSARDHFERAVARFPRDIRRDHIIRFGHDPQLVCLSRLGNTLRFLGDLDGARRARDGAVALSHEHPHPFSRGVMLVFAALLALDLDEHERVREFAAALAQEEHYARPNTIKSGAIAGYVDVLDGRTRDGFARIHRAIEICGPVNPAPGFRAALMRLLVAAHHAAGDASGGLDAVDRALELGGTRIWESDLRVMRADFLARLRRPAAEVDAELDRALAVARMHGAVGQVALVDERRGRRSHDRGQR